MEGRLDNKDLLRIMHDTARRLGIYLDSTAISHIDRTHRSYAIDQLDEFIKDLSEIANKTGIVYVKKEINSGDFNFFLKNFDAPLIVFYREGIEIIPAIIHKNKKRKNEITLIREEGSETLELKDFPTEDILHNSDGEVYTLSAFNYKSIVGSDEENEDHKKEMTPVKRLFALLSADKRDIFYVYVYAIIIGIISLVLPLGIQATIELVSGGVFFSSIYFLIGIIILGVLGTGVLQVMQITIVEYLQQRIFTKAAFEFAYKVPRIKTEAIFNLHFPELMNRFFDVITIQKGLPKLLIDLSTGLIQIAFGLLLLSFYHPFFVFFGIIMLGILFLIFYITGPKGLETSIVESKYKYKAVYWLEELARALYSFKISGTTDLPLQKTDYFVNNYLKNRRKHFKILVTQYSFVLLFKAVITAVLLIIGTILVVQREITLGQFVASEVVIILILTSVEKIIMYMDVVYDMLTAVDKISHVTDLPTEKTGGIHLDKNEEEGMNIEVKNLSFTYPNSKHPAIKDISFDINAGEKICISGNERSGKSTLINCLSAMYSSIEGIITYDKYSIRDLDISRLRDRIGKNVSMEDIFEGNILDNIIVGKNNLNEKDAWEALELVGLRDDINRLPEGLRTSILSGGKGYSETFIQKLILARCLVKKPGLIILNHFFYYFTRKERMDLVKMLTDEDRKWTLIVVSNDPIVMAACTRVIYLNQGKVMADDCLSEILKNDDIAKNLN